jgi:hypothetical protein
LLALGFLGLAQSLIELLAGRARARDRRNAPGLGGVRALTGVAVVGLSALTAAAFWLPGSDIARALVRGLG